MMHGLLVIGRHLLAAGILAGIAASPAGPQNILSSQPSLIAPLPPSGSLTGEEIFDKLVEHDRLRQSALVNYSAVRTYKAANRKGKVYAEEVVRMQYRAPDTKEFTTVRDNGSYLLRSRVFTPLINGEKEAASGRSLQDSSVTPANYRFSFIRHEDSEGCHCFVVRAEPQRIDKYLFEGTVWIDDRDFAIAKIVGRPARNPSFWIKHAEFVRTFQKIGEFWLPYRDQTDVELRIFGDRVLTIDHAAYSINK